jgi:hypothetical protein
MRRTARAVPLERLKGDADWSAAMPEGPRLTLEECHRKVAECREMARHMHDPGHRVMLEHMAATWERICEDLVRSARRDRH